LTDRTRLLAAATVLLAAVVSCAPRPDATGWVQVRDLTPAFLTDLKASDPALAADAYGRVALTWVTRDSTGKDLWLAVSADSGATFADPVRVNETPGAVVSYAVSRPEAAFGPAGRLAVTWSEQTPDGRGVGIMARASADGGATLGPPARINDDAVWDTTGRHEFGTIAFRPDGSLFAAWLEDRIPDPSDWRTYWAWRRHRTAEGWAPEGEGEPEGRALMAAVSPDGGRTWGANFMVADSACGCCRPQARVDASGEVAIGYRRAEGGLRDPALAIVNGTLTVADTVLSPDGWRFEGCPTQGPDLTWDGTNGLYTWYTAAGDTGVYVMPWRGEGGAAGLKRRLADSLAAAGSPRLIPLGAGALIAAEGVPPRGPNRTVIAVREITESGTLTPWCYLGADATSGWLAALGAHSALACWVERANGRVRLAHLRVRG